MFASKLSRRTFIAAGTGGMLAASASAGARRTPGWQALDNIIAAAVERQDLPFAVAMVANRSGVLWQGVAGHASATRPAAPDTAFRLFSMTKGIGSLAAMILVDRKKLSLDAPVAAVMPEFAELQVIDSVGPSGAVLRAPKTPATLRQLLTHTSGLAYSIWNKKEFDWEMSASATGQLSRKAGFMRPLAFDPGEAWGYGIGIDWAGFLVERVDGRRIDRFVQEEILAPLGMLDTLFEPDRLRDRLAVTRHRTPEGGFAEIQQNPPAHPEEYGMGQALYSTAPDYIKFLQFILNGTGVQGRHRIVSAETLVQMKTNQIGSTSVPVMKTQMPDVSFDVDFFPGTRKTWTFGFLRNELDIPGMRRAGSLSWAGVQNTHYWVDPAKDLAAVLMTQSLPFVEPRFMAVYQAFERQVYSLMQ